MEACNDTPHGKLTEEVGELKEAIKHLEEKLVESNEALKDLQSNKVIVVGLSLPKKNKTKSHKNKKIGEATSHISRVDFARVHCQSHQQGCEAALVNLITIFH